MLTKKGTREMNANELADNLIPFATDYKISNLDCMILSDAITMLRHQQAEIEALKSLELTNEEIVNVAKGLAYFDYDITEYDLARFADAILRKAQEK